MPSRPDPADPSVILAPWAGPFGGVPPFDRVTVAAIGPALDAAMAVCDSDPVRARMLLTRLIEGSALPTVDRLRGYDAINKINGVLVFSNRVVATDPLTAQYKVQEGDSLARIAKEQKLDCDWRLVQRINGIKSANGLHAGQSIKLPKGTFHAEVRKGEYRINMFLGEGADRQGIHVAAQHAGGVRDGLLVPDLRAGRPEVGHVGALVVRRDLEGDPGAGRRLLEDQGDVLALQSGLLVPAVLGRF